MSPADQKPRLAVHHSCDLAQFLNCQFLICRMGQHICKVLNTVPGLQGDQYCLAMERVPAGSPSHIPHRPTEGERRHS